MSTLEIKNLHASVGGKEILRGIDLTVSSGEVHAVMGPNGAGKSTLSGVVMGKPGYKVTAGSVTLDGVDMLALPAWQRAVAGLHLVMQYPTEVPGVMLDDVLTEALASRGRSSAGLDALLRVEAGRIGFDERFLDRALNVDLSGGEKKRNETLQLAILQPRIAMLDELDSGLDIDALRDCARRVEAMSNDRERRRRTARRAGDHALQPPAPRAEARSRAHPRPGTDRRDRRTRTRIAARDRRLCGVRRRGRGAGRRCVGRRARRPVRPVGASSAESG